MGANAAGRQRCIPGHRSAAQGASNFREVGRRVRPGGRRYQPAIIGEAMEPRDTTPHASHSNTMGRRISRVLVLVFSAACVLFAGAAAAYAQAGDPALNIAWSSAEADTTKSVAWGDYDGDGDLDLVAGNSGQPNRLYRNDGGSLDRPTPSGPLPRPTGPTSIGMGGLRWRRRSRSGGRQLTESAQSAVPQRWRNADAQRRLVLH